MLWGFRAGFSYYRTGRTKSSYDDSLTSCGHADKLRTINYRIPFYPVTLQRRWGTTDYFAVIPFHLVLFSAVLTELTKLSLVHSLRLSFHLFFCLHLLLFPFIVLCRFGFAKLEDLETWSNYRSFRLLTRSRSSSLCSPMAAWVSANLLICTKFSIVSGSISSQWLAFFSLTLLSRSTIQRHTQI